MADLHTFDAALLHAMTWETGGDLIDGAPHEVPGDSGGFTRWGVAQNKWPHVDVPNLTYAQAELFYIEHFWHGPRISELPDNVAVQVFDWGVNAGPRRAIRALQRELGATADGVIGPRTLEAMDARDPFRVTLELSYRRRDFYHKVAARPNQAQFLRGWERRAFSTLYLAAAVGWSPEED